MTEDAQPHNSPGASRISPYDDLYIYYLKGLAKTDAGCFDHAFIGAWLEDDFSFLFFSRPSLAEIEKFVAARPHLAMLDEYRMPYTEWQGTVLGPGNFGGFFITPPWAAAANVLSTEKRPVVLDPGVVFGSGSHPTTLSCLEALTLAFEGEPYASALDLGTGTGLLAIAAVRLGCPKVLAVDYNLLAVQTARNNIRLNRLEQRILAVQGRAQACIDIAADLVIANVHYPVMKELIASGGFLLKKGFILSGLLGRQAGDIAAELANMPVKIISKWEAEGGWHTFFGKIT